MPGGAPQGTVLGVLAFILQMNQMKTIPSIPRSSFLTPPGQKQLLTSCKYIDDNITAVSVNLKAMVIHDDSTPMITIH